MYYRGAAAAIIVYDITRVSTFDTLQVRWSGRSSGCARACVHASLHLSCRLRVCVGTNHGAVSPCCRQSWVKELHNMGPENIVLVLVGNKCDLESERVRQPCRWCCHFCYRHCAAADDDTTPSVTAVAPGGCGTNGCTWCCCCWSTRRPS